MITRIWFIAILLLKIQTTMSAQGDPDESESTSDFSSGPFIMAYAFGFCVGILPEAGDGATCCSTVCCGVLGLGGLSTVLQQACSAPALQQAISGCGLGVGTGFSFRCFCMGLVEANRKRRIANTEQIHEV